MQMKTHFKIVTLLLLAPLFLLTACNKNTGNNRPLVPTEEIDGITSIENTFQLEIKPKISEPEGGNSYFHLAKQNFVEEWLPNSDSYLFVDTNRPELSLASNWIAKDIMGQDVLVVNLNNWSYLPKEIKEQAILMHYIRLSAYTSYEIKSFNIVNKMVGNRSFLNGQSLEKWITKWISSTQFPMEANCYFLSLKATGMNLNSSDNINEQSFLKTLKRIYKKVAIPQTGDLVLFERKDGFPLHSAAFVGVSSLNKQQRILLSKFGGTKGFVQFIDEYTLRNRIHTQNLEVHVSFWRKENGAK